MRLMSTPKLSKAVTCSMVQTGQSFPILAFFLQPLKLLFKRIKQVILIHFIYYGSVLYFNRDHKTLEGLFRIFNRTGGVEDIPIKPI